MVYEGGVNGLNNLWFVSAIFICYLTTPLLQGLRRVAPIVLILILGYGMMEYTIIQHDIFIYEAPFIYSIGYMLANVRSKESNVVVALFLIVAVCIAFNIDEEHIKAFSGVQNRLLHLSAGVSLSYIFIKGIAKVQFIKANRGIKFLDKYSYQIYLAHHPFILGPITLISISPWMPLNIIIILTITLVLSYLLTIVTDKINSIIKL